MKNPINKDNYLLVRVGGVDMFVRTCFASRAVALVIVPAYRTV